MAAVVPMPPCLAWARLSSSYSQSSAPVHSQRPVPRCGPLSAMSLFPRHRPAPLLEDEEDSGNGDGSVPLDSLALLLATAFLLAYLALHTLTGWASIATCVPLTAALLYHWYRDQLPHSTAASIEAEQAQLSALVKAAVMHTSNRKKRIKQGSSTRPALDTEAQEAPRQPEQAGEDPLPARSPQLFLQLTSPNAHSHPIELADADTSTAKNGRRSVEFEHSQDGGDEKAAAGTDTGSVQQHRAVAAVVSPTRSTATGADATSVQSPKTPTTILDAEES